MVTNRVRQIGLAVATACALAAGSTAMAGSPGVSHGGGGGHVAVGHSVARGAWGGPGYYHGGWGGWHGGGWHGGWYGGWGYGWGFWGAGLWLSTLPWGYSTYWWGGVPYYYVDNTYYNWDATTGVYRAVPPPAGHDDGTAPPAGAPAQAGPAPGVPAGELFMYPKAGQSADQQAKDRYECHQWAAQQTGFDPTQPAGGVPADQAAAKRAEYLRADGACLEGRNYSVK